MIAGQDETIERILQEAKTIAVVGMSDRPSRAGYYVPAYMQKVGYRVIPVNPNHEGEILGEQVYPNLEAVPEHVDLVLLFQRSENVPPFVDAAIAIGADAIWMQSGIANEQAAAKARATGVAVVMDACMMVEHRRRAF